MSFNRFFKDEENSDVKIYDQYNSESLNNDNIEKLEFGYIKEVYRDNMNIEHTHIYHELKLDEQAEQLWEIFDESLKFLELSEFENEDDVEFDPELS